MESFEFISSYLDGMAQIMGVVTFGVSESTVLARCNCEIALKPTLCKHRELLIQGDTSVLDDQNQVVEFKELFPKLKPLTKLYERFLAFKARPHSEEQLQNAIADFDKAIYMGISVE